MSRSEKILIVEDEAAVREALEIKLKKEGFSEVLIAEDGMKGLITAIKEQPNLILLDIMMPELDGITTLKKLREDDWGKSVPVIVLSNMGDEEKIRQSLELGARGYLVKSNWSLDDVMKTINEELY